jgi:hypothetical protein
MPGARPGMTNGVIGAAIASNTPFAAPRVCRYIPPRDATGEQAMSVMEVLLPVFVQVILTLYVAYVLAYQRVTLLRSGELRGKEIALREPNFPEHTRKYENSYLNQFELPVLFYVLMILLLITRQADMIQMTLAWIFVVSRIAHAYEHLTSNNVRIRGPLFGIGLFVLSIMWGIFMVGVIRVY